MEKRTDLQEWKEREADRRLEETMKQEFPLPDRVEKAKREAFAEIRRRVKEAEIKGKGGRVCR